MTKKKKKSVITLETVSECLEFCNSDTYQRRSGAAITLPTDFFKPKRTRWRHEDFHSTVRNLRACLPGVA